MNLSSQTPGKFSCAKTVMDKEDGWNEDRWAMNDGEQDGELVRSWGRTVVLHQGSDMQWSKKHGPIQAPEKGTS